MLSITRSSLALLIFILPFHLFGQSKISKDKTVPDYRIIQSNESFIELEYYPHYTQGRSIVAGGVNFNSVDFDNSETANQTEVSHPELKLRAFSVFLPGMENNSAAVVDYDAAETANFRLAPAPGYYMKDPNKKGFENIEQRYDYNPAYYSQNSFSPQNPVELTEVQETRDLITGVLRIYPYRYNPAASTLIKYSRIKVRITFGSRPFMLNKPRPKEEIVLLSGAGINSGIALNWTNPRLGFRAVRDVFSSALSAGDWYKIEIKDNGSGGSQGIYKITKSFLQSNGINVDGIDPHTIKIYGNGGNMQPDSIYTARPIDLQQIPILVRGEGDGSFDAQDYILFYARSVNNWTYNYTTNLYAHHLNPYSAANYYWLCLNTAGNGMRMETVNSENNPNPLVVSSFKERVFYEPEVNNLLEEGNLWLSERHSANDPFLWNKTITGLQANSDIYYSIRAAARVVDPGNCPYYINFLLRDALSNVADYVLHLYCVSSGFENWVSVGTGSFIVNASQKTPPNSEQVQLSATFSTNAPVGDGYLDWMEIQYIRRLNSAANDALEFDSPGAAGPVEYNVSSFSNDSIKVFDVTNHNGVKIIQPLSATANNVRFQKTQTKDNLSRFVVMGPTGYKTPTSISEKVPNQNLHGISDGSSVVIITHPDLIPAANRLKAKKEAGGPGDINYLKTTIYTCDQIYNEFSGGLLDPVAIRDFLKNAYENWQTKPVYVLLLGDGDIDYKHILVQNKNWVPPYEITDDQINQVQTYVTDDFYANITGFSIPNSPPDLSIGRIPARSLDEANKYLDKEDCYLDPSNNGYWKTKIIFVADDAHTSDGCEGNEHIPAAEELSTLYTPEFMEEEKIYLPSYPTVITSQGRRKPDVNADIIKKWNDGCIGIHYVGHGSPDVWAHEYVLEKDVVMSLLHNTCKYPFVSIASCDMSKFDDPLGQCAAEEFTMAPLKGAIGTLAASRPVYAGDNEALMIDFFHNMYQRRDTLLLQERFGSAVYQTKQTHFDVNSLKYILMGDPTIRIQLPRFHSKIDSISGLAADTMRALSKINIYGSVINPDSSLWQAYNGKIDLKVFDVPESVSITDECATYNFVLNGGIIYSGSQNIRNGKWKIEYVVPRDISYLNQNGKMTDYFYNVQADGVGLFKNFIIGGVDPNAAADTTGPQISLYLNARSFHSGDPVNNDFTLIADLSDESGINTTGTIGHKIEATLDNDNRKKLDLSSFYNSDTTYKTGSLSYDFRAIADGKHNLTLRAYDTYNNASEKNIEFNVMSTATLQVVNVYNFPNPFRDRTVFTFQHNYPGLINVKIKIYTVSGRLIKQLKKDNVPDKFVEIEWAGTDEDGDAISNGVYLYTLAVTSSDGITRTTIGKMASLK